MRTAIDKSAVGARIRAARENLKWSQGDLARNLGPNPDGKYATQTSVSMWERGERLPLYRIADLARVLGKTEEWLRYGDSEPAPDEIAEMSEQAGVSRTDAAAVLDALRRMTPDQARRLLHQDPGTGKRAAPPTASNVRSIVPPERRAKRRVR